MDNKTITIHQIAKMVGVNASTVSRVFNPNCGHSISKPIREKVLAIANKHEYAPRSSARSLAHGKSFNIGIILHNLIRDLSSPTLALLLNEFIREALMLGYQTVLLPVQDGNFDEQVVKQIRSGNADAYFLGTTLVGTKTMQELDKRQLPAVTYISDCISDEVIKSEIYNLISFSVDNNDAYEKLFRTVKARGFTEFAILKLSKQKHITNRFQALEKAADYGLQFRDSITYSSTSSFLADRAEAFKNALDLMPQIKKHRLIICYSDLMALGLCDALRFNGIVPGKDISVIGCDNIEANPAYNAQTPFITTIDKNERKIGKQMVQALLDKLNNRKVSNMIKVSADFIMRDSLGEI